MSNIQVTKCLLATVLWFSLSITSSNLLSAQTSTDPPLIESYNKLNIDPASVTVSGVSSGAYLAVQLHIAFSETIHGVGSIGGGPYYCAENLPPSKLTTIKARCMFGAVPVSAAPFIKQAKAAASQGKIDSLSNLNNDNVLIFNSLYDQIINPGLGALSVIFYREFVTSGTVKGMNSLPGFLNYAVAHGIPTAMSDFDNYLNYVDLATPCSPANSQIQWWYPNEIVRGNDPWMYDCQYPNGYLNSNPAFDFVQYLFEFLYGEDAIKDSVPASPDNLVKISQLQYIDDPSITTVAELQAKGIGEFAYAYIPSTCIQGNQCKLHIALHGCQMFPQWQFTGKIGSRYAGETVTFGNLFYNGPYNGVAEANNIVVLYPQAYSISRNKLNPYGCWEFWAFEDADVDNYYTKNGRQMKLIYNLINFISAPGPRLH